MAEALVSFLLEQLRSIVVGELVREVKLIEGVEKEVESLTATLTMIQAVLKDADEKQVKNEAVKLWLEQLKDVSYDVDDVLDEWFTRTLLSKLQTPEVNTQIKENGCSIFVSLVCCLKPVVLRHEFGVKIKELNERLDGIAKKKDMYNLTEIRSEKESRPITSSVVDVSDILGRNDDKEVIVSKLLGGSSCGVSKVPVISIVGMGGFGKTTLAKLILKEEKVISYFEKQLWVCVSDPFDHQKVVKQIIEAATGKVIESVSWEALLKHLSESINGKRFILVLDDVWSYNVEDWYQLKTSLNGGAVGSRIIITTRDEKIAKLMDCTYIHWLGQLSDNDSWLMFKSIAFKRREDDLEFLGDVAKDITHKCKGVPISIKVLSSALRLEKNIQGWRSVQASNIWKFQERGVGFLPSILFSYSAIPAELKPCLVYCAILPKDSKIKKKEIVELWMAQGYLGYDGSKDLEIKGEHYFDDLAMRSFFQDIEKDSKGNITSCKMHDLVHDIVQFLSESETCNLEKQELKSDNIRHLTTLNFNIPSIYKLNKLRTLRRVLDGGLINTNFGLLHKLACLRVLDLSNSDLRELPSGVEKLIHLRYLNLSAMRFLVELPETLCNLLNLQTLKLNYCFDLAQLPKGLGKLCNLRHLMLKGTNMLKYFPQEFGRLSCLRTLDKFIIGEWCNINEFKLLNHLQGELRIKNLGKVVNANKAAEAELEKKKNLQSLILSFSDSENEEENDGDKKILEGLVPHTNLEKLIVKYYRGTKFPNWISSLSSLVKLEFKMLKHLLQLPCLGMLPFLEVLLLNKLKMVKRVGEEFYGLNGCGGGRRDSVQQIVFPKLKKLEFANMNAWEEWDLPYRTDNNIDFFPNLVELNISDCNGLQALPPGLGKLKSVESIELRFMDGLKCLISREFLKLLSEGGVDDNNGEFVKPPPTEVVLFPSLTYLLLVSMGQWEEETTPDFEVDSTTTITIMPHLFRLEIFMFPKLKVIPFYLLPDALRDLKIHGCPQLTGMQPGLPPFLEKLTLQRDVGFLNSSLLPLLHNNYYPSLYYFEISFFLLSSFLPQGLNLLTSIQQLKFLSCEYLDFMPDKLKPLARLKQLEIISCPILAQRFKGGDISSSGSYDDNITIRPEQLAEIEKSSHSDVCGHIGVRCNNCQTKPIVGKRYRCKDCWQQHIRTRCGVGFDLCEDCYHTRSNHPDLVNQHNTLGHTIELIANPGDIPVHPDETSEDVEGSFVGPKPAEIEEHI